MADGAGACRPCSIHIRTSDKALGVESPDADTYSVTLVSGVGEGEGLMEQVRVCRALFTTERVTKHWEKTALMETQARSQDASMQQIFQLFRLNELIISFERIINSFKQIIN